VTDLPTEEAFRDALGETFLVRLDSGETVRLELAEVTSHGDRGSDTPEGVRRRPFSLLFRGDPALALPQRIHRLEHERLGEQDIFIVPLQPDDDGTRFEAVFG
jgi:hypothetical protein